jgi:ABC-type Fe3+-hydroxamate transport system substrate-binding protein
MTTTTTTRRPTAALLGLALALLLAACGTTDDGDGDEAADTQPEPVSEECADVETSTGPVSLTDSLGREVELDAPAEKIAVLEWQQVEDALSLCVTPVAVADAEGYSLWDTAEELPEGVEDVGGRGEPNIDALYATDPDLIIVEAATPTDEIITSLEDRGVPVLATTGADAADPVQNMIDVFELIAQAVGREDRAAEVVEEFETRLEEARGSLADVEPKEFVYLDGYITGGNVALRPFGQGSLMGELGEELGLTNAWTGEVDEAYGLGETDIEGLTDVGDANFLYTGTVDPDGDVVAELEANPIWSSLPAVAEGRTHAFPPGIWTFGGPRSAIQVIDAYVDVLT